MAKKITVFDIEEEFDRAFDEFQKDRYAERKDWEMYSGFDYGQWPEEAKRDLMRSNRHIIQLNYVRGKIDTLAGTIVKNGLEVDFVPVDDDAVDVTKVLKGLFYSDRELMDWDAEYLETVKDGLIHRGIEQMYISEKYSPLGNIGFRRMQPGHVILDPNWNTHTSKDLLCLWKVAYLTPKEIKEIYNKKSDAIEAAVYRKANQITDYEKDETTDSMTRFNLENIYGDKYRVIEYHHIRTKRVKKKIYVGKNGTEDVSEMTDEEIQQFINDSMQDNPGEIIEKDKVEREYWVTTTCAVLLGYSEFLEDAKSEIQIGRLPFFPWSAARIAGKDSGIVALLKDAQQAINKRESLSDHIIASSAHGAMFVDSALFSGDINKTETAIKDLDKPNARIVTSPGVLATGRNYFYQVPKAQYQGELYQEIQRMQGHLDTISKSTPTLEGRSESAHDTGVLFARRQMQSEIALTTIAAGIEQHWNEKGEAYMALAQTLYSGPYRKFKTDYGIKGDDKETIELNNGQYTLENLPRTKVAVSQSPRGVTLREVERSLNAELLQRIPPNQYVYQAAVMQNIMKTLDMTGEEKKRLDAANAIESKLAVTRAKAEISNLEFQMMQMQMQAQQMQAQMGGQAPQGAGAGMGQQQGAGLGMGPKQGLGMGQGGPSPEMIQQLIESGQLPPEALEQIQQATAQGNPPGPQGGQGMGNPAQPGPGPRAQAMLQGQQ